MDTTGLAKLFSRASIRRKLVIIIMFTSVVALSFASTAFIILDRQTVKRSMQQELAVLAKVIAMRSAAALTFQDRRTAAANLESLGVQSAIQTACMYDYNGKVFAKYAREDGTAETKTSSENAAQGNIHSCPTASTEPTSNFTDRGLELFRAVELHGNPIGSLYVHASTQQLTDRLLRFAGFSSAIIFVALLIAYLVTARLQRLVSDPILDLGKVAVKVKEKNDYSLRVNKTTEDEVGYLVDSFNGMLGTIEEAQARLTDLVAELKVGKAESDANALSAEQKSKAVSEFFAGASHDLRQPLHAMGMFAEALRGSDDKGEQKQLLEKLMLSINNMSELFSDLLNLSRLDSTATKPKLSTVQLGDIFKKIKADFYVVAEEKGLQLFVDDSDLSLTSDSIMLERILRNLVSNAIRYTEKGDVVLGVKSSTHVIEIQVTDSGPGIPEEKQKAIFQSYIQLEEESKETAKGFGLGLSIVDRLSHLLGYQIKLVSNPGQGSCFSVLIPIQKTQEDVSNLTDIDPSIEAETAESLTSSEPINAKVNQPFAGLTFLLIDDDASILDAMNTLLTGWGGSCILAGTAGKAVEQLDELGIVPALIISDYHLSEHDTGFEAINSVIEYLDEDVPAIVITGHEESDDFIAQNELQLSVLHKPLKPAQLRALINHTLGI